MFSTQSDAWGAPLKSCLAGPGWWVCAAAATWGGEVPWAAAMPKAWPGKEIDRTTSKTRRAGAKDMQSISIRAMAEEWQGAPAGAP